MKCGESSLEINFVPATLFKKIFSLHLMIMQMFRIDLQELIGVEKTLTTINRLQKVTRYIRMFIEDGQATTTSNSQT